MTRGARGPSRAWGSPVQRIFRDWQLSQDLLRRGPKLTGLVISGLRKWKCRRQRAMSWSRVVVVREREAGAGRSSSGDLFKRVGKRGGGVEARTRPAKRGLVTSDDPAIQGPYVFNVPPTRRARLGGRDSIQGTKMNRNNLGDVTVQ